MLGDEMAEAPYAPPRAPVKRAFLAGFVLHSIALAWLWSRYSEGARGGLLVWMDLPWSLAYLGRSGGALLAWSARSAGRGGACSAPSSRAPSAPSSTAPAPPAGRMPGPCCV